MSSPRSSSSRESRRLEALARYNILDTAPEEGFDRVTRLAARWLDVPIALVTLLDKSRQWFKSCVGLDVRETDRDVAFCVHNLAGTELLVVEDARTDPRFADNPLVTGPPGIRFYAGAPLVTPDGHVLGALCVIDTVPRRAAAMDLDVLWDLAGVVVTELELRERTRRVQALTRELRRAQETGRSELSQLLQEDLRQVLQAARMTLETVSGTGDLSDTQTRRLERAAGDLGAATDIIRGLSARFAPPVEHQPLRDTLEWLADRMEADHGLSVSVRGHEPTLGPEGALKVLIYRLVREYLFAARQDGEANQAHVRLTETGGRLRLTVEDDGPWPDPTGADRGRALRRLRAQIEALGGRVQGGPGAGLTIEGPPVGASSMGNPGAASRTDRAGDAPTGPRTSRAESEGEGPTPCGADGP